MDLILKDMELSRGLAGSLEAEAHTLVYKLPPHLQLGLAIYLRQDLINNLQLEDAHPVQQTDESQGITTLPYQSASHTPLPQNSKPTSKP